MRRILQHVRRKCGKTHLGARPVPLFPRAARTGVGSCCTACSLDTPHPCSSFAVAWVERACALGGHRIGPRLIVLSGTATDARLTPLAARCRFHEQAGPHQGGARHTVQERGTGWHPAPGPRPARNLAPPFRVCGASGRVFVLFGSFLRLSLVCRCFLSHTYSVHSRAEICKGAGWWRAGGGLVRMVAAGRAGTGCEWARKRRA